MRRSDRAVNDLADILAILDKCEVMRLGLCAKGKPYIVPMHFAFERADEKLFIYFHCASQGRKLDMIAENNSACFEADILVGILESDTACGWSSEYQSVTGEGKISVLRDKGQKVRALDMLMKRHGFQGVPSYDEQALSAVTVLRIDVTSITGKQKLGKKP